MVFEEEIVQCFPQQFLDTRILGKSNLAQLSGHLRRQSDSGAIIEEREVGSNLTHPQVLEFAVWRRARKLEEMPVLPKPGLTNVPEYCVVAHEAHCRCLGRNVLDVRLPV